MNGEAALTTINVERMWKIKQGIRGILQRGKCSGVVLEIILGHFAFAALVNRHVLSIFEDCYMFMRASYFTAAKLWPSVVEELEAFGNGIFLLEQSWTRQWNQLVGCGHASMVSATLGGLNMKWQLWGESRSGADSEEPIVTLLAKPP